MARPESQGPAHLVYDMAEAKKYAQSSRMIDIQTRMTKRALELLALPAGERSYVLDLGCGSGLSGEVLTEAGHEWVGLDVSPSMLGVALQRQVPGDLFHSDMGQGLFFRPATFDAAISISAVQWLTNADKKSHVPQKRLRAFFASLYRCLVRGGRFAFQLYPESPQALELICRAAVDCGFSGGIVTDFPNSGKARKIYLVFQAGPGFVPPAGLSDAHAAIMGIPDEAAMSDSDVDMRDSDDDSASDAEEVDNSAEAVHQRTLAQAAQDALMIDFSKPVNPGEIEFSMGVDKSQRRKPGSHRNRTMKDKTWVQAKKEQRRARGMATTRDSKFTARRRKPNF